MGGIRWWVAAALVLLAPSAAASEPQLLELTANVSGLEAGSGTLKVQDALMRLEVGPSETPFLELDDPSVRVTQYWANATDLNDPLMGRTQKRHLHPVEFQTLDVEPRRIVFVEPTDGPEVRLAASSLNGITIESCRSIRMDATAPLDLLGRSRAYENAPVLSLSSFAQAPDQSGWVEAGASALGGPGIMDLLIDGWQVRLEGEDNSMDFRAGTTHDHSHAIGEGGHYETVYTFLVVHLTDANVRLPPESRLEGYATAPRLEWNGAARIDLEDGQVAVGGARIPLATETVRLDGRFKALVEFGPQTPISGASFQASGIGVTSLDLPDATGAFAGVQRLSVWSSVALGAITVAMLGVQTYRSPRRTLPVPGPVPEAPQPQPPPLEKLGLDELIERAQKAPLDGPVQFRLGVTLVRMGQADVGLRALDRSFRLHPPAIMQLLEDPELAAVRDRQEVRVLLGRFQREQHRKVWAGYA